MDKFEAARYLGIKPSALDKRTEELIEKCGRKLEQTAAPKHIHAVFDISVSDENVSFPDFEVKSRDLAKHIDSCSQAALFAATLGVAADRLISTASYSDISEAAVMQACAAVLIEEYCDEAMKEVASAEHKKFLRPRFSPGYGDFSVSHQKDILTILRANARIGLFATDSNMLVPSKSVTAVIGITDKESSCNINKCADCGNKFCVFRKE
ncbi:MAG: Vitamin B12 dependent methionine synthase activation subunit [Clostridia bacterium]|nr:Vitamin B12 dependent methionine synthase activation subunit [Clostridia bacterium]